MNEFGVMKIVVSGPVGAGKSTFIRCLSEIEVVDTDVASTENIGKANTTVAMDFGTLNLDGVAVHLFGTPGQERFDFMWDVLCEGALGLVLLVSGAKPNDLPQARRILEFITSRISVPFVIGVTHLDMPKVWDAEEVAEFFELDPKLVVGVNARDGASCAAILIHLLESVLFQPAAVSPQGSLQDS